MTGKRKRYSAELKAKVAMETLRGELTAFSWRPSMACIRRRLGIGSARRDSAIAEERDALTVQNDRLRHPLLKLKRMQFGAKSERLPEEQLQLGLEDLEQAIVQGEAEAGRRDPALKQERAAKRRANRGALPAHLPQIRARYVARTR